MHKISKYSEREREREREGELSKKRRYDPFSLTERKSVRERERESRDFFEISFITYHHVHLSKILRDRERESRDFQNFYKKRKKRKNVPCLIGRS